MTEYEELREEIAKRLSESDGWDRLELIYYRQKADLALSIIAERCWFKNEGKAGNTESEQFFTKIGWRPVKEIKKEAK